MEAEMRARVPESKVNALARRAAKLSEIVERATQSSAEKSIRDAGAQLIELLSERIEEIRELHQLDDEDLIDRMNMLALRLKLAEAKVNAWGLPQLKEPANNKRRTSSRARRAA
jgi:hypothetical protein